MIPLATKMASPMLLWFVSYSNLTSIAIITLCFLAMTIFIGFVSMNGDHPGRANLPLGVEQRSMVKVSNPFFLRLEQQSRRLADGIKLHLSSLLPSNVFVMWGVKISPFHDFILKPGGQIRKTFVSGMSEEDCQELESLHCDKIQFSEPGEHTITFSCPPTVSGETLGDMPRTRYPVAVFIFVPEDPSQGGNATPDSGLCSESDREINNDTSTDDLSGSSDAVSETEKSNSIVGLISIVHLRDEKVPQHSHIISQYVKTAGVPLYSLQPLYMSGESNQAQQSQEEEDDAPHDEDTTDVRERHESRHKELDSCESQKLSAEKVAPCQGTRMQSDGMLGACSSDFVGSQSDKDEEKIDSCPSCGSEGLNTEELELRKRNVQNLVDQHETLTCDRCHSCSQDVVGGSSDIERKDKYCNRKKEQQELNKDGRDTWDVKDRTRDNSESSTTSVSECVVCQTHRVRCALLPCRHACVCLGCLKLLDRCPMCRGGMDSYFLLSSNGDNGDDETDDDEDEDDSFVQNMQHQAVNANFTQMWERFNERLNALLGFR